MLGRVFVICDVCPGCSAAYSALDTDSAQALYEDLKPPSAESRLPKIAGVRPPGTRSPGAGRPTKQERRALDRLRRDP